MILNCKLINKQQAGILIDTASVVKLIWQADRAKSCLDLTFHFYGNKEAGKSCLGGSFQQQYSVICTWLLLPTLPLAAHVTQSEFHNLVGFILKVLNALISNTPSSQKSMWFQSI